MESAAGIGGGGDGGEGSFASLAAALVELAPVIDGDPTLLSRDERSAAAATMVDVIDRAEATATHLAGASSDAGDHLDDGARTMGRWLAARTEAHSGRIASLLALHRDLAPFDRIGEAWRSGTIGTAKVRAMLRAARHLETQMIRDQHELVARISPLTVSRAEAVLGRWRHEALQELDESPDDPRPTDQPVNSLRYRPGVGTETHAEAILDAIVNAEFQSLIDAEIDRGFRTGRYRSDDDVTIEERRLDALLALMRRGTLVLTEGGESKKSVIINVDARLLHPDLGSTTNTGSTTGAGAVERAPWPCGLLDGTPLTREQVLAVLADQPAVTAMLGFYGLNGRFTPVGETTTARLANASQRRILKIRDHSCLFPGCASPAARCLPHHEPPFDITRRTTTDELVLLCHHHHRLRHEQGFTFVLTPDGELTVTRPDGRPLPAVRPGHKIPVAPPPAGSTRPDPRPPAAPGPTDRSPPPEPTSTDGRTRRRC